MKTATATLLLALVLGYFWHDNFVNHEVKYIHCELGSEYGYYVVNNSNDTNYVGISQVSDYHVKGKLDFTCSK